MKFRKLVYLLIALAVFAGLAIFKKIGDEKKEKTEQKEAVKTEMVVNGIDASIVQKIVLRQGEDKATEILFKRPVGGEWLVENYFNARAKQWQMEQLLKNVSEIKGELRSDSKEVLSDYSMTDDKGVHLQFFGPDKEFLHLVVSPERTPANANFVRRAGSNKVYLTETDLLASLSLYDKTSKLESKSFADFQVVRLDPVKVTRVELATKKGPLALVKNEDKEKKTVTWTAEPAVANEELDAGKVNTVIGTLSNLYGMQILDPAQDYGFDLKASWVRIAHAKDDKPLQTELYLGKLDAVKKTYAVKAMPEALVYEVNQASVDAVKTDRAEFVKETPKEAPKEAPKKK